jgi:aminoglycoside phosphotransferase (APT) family kinase protein
VVIARIYFGDGSGEKVAHEFAVLAGLTQAGYPCPRPLWMETPSVLWERPVLFMQRVPGEPIWGPMLRGDVDTRRAFRGAFVRAFVALHLLDLGETDLPKKLGVPAPHAAVTGQVDGMRRAGLALPEIGFGPAVDLLSAQAKEVRPGHVGLVHWDFHPANVLAELGQANAEVKVTIIDWSGAEVTDTRFDLAWTLVVIGSQEGWEAAAPILQEYEALCGPQADLEFFLRLAYARRLYVMTMALMHGASVLGLRAGVESAIRDRLDGMRMMYAKWLDATGTSLPTVEQILER